MRNRIEELYRGILRCRGVASDASRTARLLRRSRNKKAGKLAEEALETALAFLKKDRQGVITESVDLLYHLTVLWTELGIAPAQIWAEMDRRKQLLGLAEKLPKHEGASAPHTTARHRASAA